VSCAISSSLPLPGCDMVIAFSPYITRLIIAHG
jgi:hypothetical protein